MNMQVITYYRVKISQTIFSLCLKNPALVLFANTEYIKFSSRKVPLR